MHIDGYEVEGEGSNFVCAFDSPDAAVRFSLQLQLNLMQLDWPPEVLDNQWTCEQFGFEGEKIFGGPRVAIGMSTGDATKWQPCDRTGRIEYFGPVLSQSARVAAAAHGGQVRMDG